MPVLERIVNSGVMGNLSSIRPMLSPILWNSIATGKRPHKHGVPGFTEVDYEMNQVVAVSSASRKCKALWEILNESSLKTHVVGWFATHPAEALQGVCVSDRFGSPAPAPGEAWPLARRTVFPDALGEILADLRIRPEEIAGDVLSLFVPEAAQVNQKHDKRLHQIAIRLAECFSIHAAATHLIEQEPWDFAAVYYRSIDWLCHDFMAFHPPRMSGIYDRDFELYHDVVSSAYRLHDLLLGRLLQLAGPETTVLLVSDHGFESGKLRPEMTPDVPAGIAVWHRHLGVLALRGEGLRQDELIHGASLLDVTPTVLALFGLPVGADMDGRVLAEAFETPLEIQTIESWETTIATEPLSAPPVVRRSAEEEKSLVRQFVELGYIADPGSDPVEAVAATERENRWNLALSHLDVARYADALPLLEEVYEDWPERKDYAFQLALCQLNLGLEEQAQETIEGLASDAGNVVSTLLQANVELRRGHSTAALACLEQAEAAGSSNPAVQNQIGLAHLRLSHWAEAERAFGATLLLDPENPPALLGLAQAHLRQRRYQEAAETALQAIGLRYDMPLAHYQLGIALARLGENARAIQALETCLHFRPLLTSAHRYLAALYRRQPGGAARGERHSEVVRERGRRRADWTTYQTILRQEVDRRAVARVEARRQRRAKSLPVEFQGAAASAPLEFLIVSGLPRSGTSLMMQILDAGGLPVMRDHLRPPDESNPRGYFEWEEIKHLPKNPRVIEKAHGRVTKVISMLLPALPRKHRFRVIFMNREIGAVAASQKRMRTRLAGANRDDAGAAERMRDHRGRTLDLLRRTPTVDLLEIDYDELLAAPRALLERLAEFAGIDHTRIEGMAAAIDPQLRHAPTAGAPISAA